MRRLVVPLLIFVCIGSIASLHAAPPRDAARMALDFLLTQAGQNGYERLKALYESGSTPAEADLKHWLVGRWIGEENPDKAGGALLIGAMVDEVPGGGPVFGERLAVTFQFANIASPTQYDNLNQAALQSHKTWFDANHRTFSRPHVEDNAILVASPGIKSKFSIRKNQSYIVVHEIHDSKPYYHYYFKAINP